MKNGPISYFVGNPVASRLLMIFLILGGVLAGFNLPVQHFPDIDLRTVTVTVLSPGSSPREVEEDINRRIEESVVGLPGVARVLSTASEGFARIDVEAKAFADPGTVLGDVRDAVDGIENFPPVSAEPARVELKELRLEVLTLSVSASTLSENGLRLVAENIRDDLLALPSVSQIRLRGARDREIAIEMTEEELRRYDLSISQVASRIRQASLNLTFGELRTGGGGVTLYAVGKRKNGEEFEDIAIVTRPDGTTLRLGDLATIRDGFVDERLLSEVDGRPAVLIRVEAAEGQSLTAAASEIKDWLADYKPPDGVDVDVWNDRAEPMFERLSEIVRNGVIGAILVFICLVLVFDLRVATWIAVGIPLSFVGAMMLFNLADLTLNMGTVFAFFLLIGIVVDDAVVVGESIAAERERGKRGLEAAISGARAVVGPVTVGVLTTIVALIPLLYITTGNYQILQVIPWVAMFVLFVSLVEAFWILPSHLSHEGGWSLSPLRDIQDRVRLWMDDLRDAVVLPVVSWSVRHFYLTFLIGLLFVFASVLLLRTEIVRLVVFDKNAAVSDTMQADLRLPAGAPFEASVAAARRYAEAARRINEQIEGTSIKSISLTVGRLGDIGSSRTGEDESSKSHLASVRLHLHERPFREASPEVIARLWRENVGNVPGLESVSVETARIQTKPSVAYALLHDNPQTLRKAVGELKAFMTGIPGLYEISDSFALGKRHLEVQLTSTGEAAGLTSAMIGKQLRANLHGLEVQRIQRGRGEVRVVVRYPAERRRSLRELASERILLPGGVEIPLSIVARVTERRELATLTRIDGRRAGLVNGRADVGEITPIQARRIIAEGFLPGLMAKYPGLSISLDAGAREERTTLETMMALIPIVLLVMYGLMAALLRSYWKPVVAVVGIPVAFAGAVFGHWILDWNITIASIFGIVGVAGVIVNDALVLLDRYNTLRRDKEAIPAIAAASAAARDRFRAVFLTSLTTVLGLSPLLYERSDELVFLVPFVVSMLGGLVAAGAFTLLMLPALVMFVEGRREA